MKTPGTWLGAPGVVCALGAGMEAVAARAFAGDARGMRAQSGWVAGRSLTLGAYAGPLPQLPAGLPTHRHSRNNQLLWAAAGQIAPQWQAAVQRHGAARVAVVVGTSTAGVNDNVPHVRPFAEQGVWPTAYDYRRQELGAPAAFLAAQLGLRGPAYTISTACTSSARAFLSAQRLLAMQLCDAVLCGGADTLCRLTINGFAALDAVDAQRCLPFSANRRGINIGEAGVLFVMTRDRPPGPAMAFLGGGASSDAHHMSAPDPSGAGAQRAMHAALRAAGVTAGEVGWVNLHGTATPHNDAMESLAMQAVFPGGVPCASTKALTGHTLGTAGALEAALVQATITDADRRLIAHAWDGVPDPALPRLDFSTPAHRWPRTGPRVAMSNSFAFGGSNVSLLFADAA